MRFVYFLGEQILIVRENVVVESIARNPSPPIGSYKQTLKLITHSNGLVDYPACNAGQVYTYLFDVYTTTYPARLHATKKFLRR